MSRALASATATAAKPFYGTKATTLSGVGAAKPAITAKPATLSSTSARQSAATATAAAAQPREAAAAAQQEELASLRGDLAAARADAAALATKLADHERALEQTRAGADAEHATAVAAKAQLKGMLAEQQEQLRLIDFASAVARTRALLQHNATESLGRALRLWAVASTAKALVAESSARTSPAVTYALPLSKAAAGGPNAAVGFAVGAGSALEIRAVKLAHGARLLMRARDGAGRPIGGSAGKWSVAFDAALSFGLAAGTAVPPTAPLLAGDGPPGAECTYEFAAVSSGIGAAVAPPAASASAKIKPRRPAAADGEGAAGELVVTFVLHHGVARNPGAPPPPPSTTVLTPVPPRAAPAPAAATAAAAAARPSTAAATPAAGAAHKLALRGPTGSPAPRPRPTSAAGPPLGASASSVAPPAVSVAPAGAGLRAGGGGAAAQAAARQSSPSRRAGSPKRAVAAGAGLVGERVFAWSGGRGGVVLAAPPSHAHAPASSGSAGGYPSAAGGAPPQPAVGPSDDDAALAAAFVTYESTCHVRGRIAAKSLRGALHASGLSLHGPGAQRILHEEESGRGSGPNAVLDYPSFARIAHRLAAARDAALAGQPRAAGY